MDLRWCNGSMRVEHLNSPASQWTRWLGLTPRRRVLIPWERCFYAVSLQLHDSDALDLTTMFRIVGLENVPIEGKRNLWEIEKYTGASRWWYGGDSWKRGKLFSSSMYLSNVNCLLRLGLRVHWYVALVITILVLSRAQIFILEGLASVRSSSASV